MERVRSLAERVGNPPWLAGSVLRVSAAIAHQTGDYERALAELDQAITLFEPIYGADSTTTTRLRDAKVDILRALGRRDEAIAVGRRSIEAFERRYGPHHPQTAKAQGRVAAVLEDLGDLEQLTEQTQNFLLLLTDGIFNSQYVVVNELLVALMHNIPIIVVCETDTRHGGLMMHEFRNQFFASRHVQAWPCENRP